MKRMFLYSALPFLPLLLLLGTSSADGAAASPAVRSAPLPAVAICRQYDGTACSPEGFTFLCYNHYPDEPGLCECTGGLWSCS